MYMYTGWEPRGYDRREGGGVHARTIGMGEGVNTHVIPSRVNTFADLLGVVIAI